MGTQRIAQDAKLPEKEGQLAHIQTHAEIASNEPWRAIQPWRVESPKLTSGEVGLELRPEVQRAHNQTLLLPQPDQHPVGWRLTAHHRRLHLIRNDLTDGVQRRSMSDRQRR